MNILMNILLKSVKLIFHNYKWKYICLYDRNLFTHYVRKIIKNQRIFF